MTTSGDPLPLDSPRWGTLEQAYGGAEDVPRLLGALETLPEASDREAVWFALWRLLVRAERTFTAAYAAVPHLVAVAARLPLVERVEAIHLACRVEVARRAAGSPPVPDDLLEGYAASVDRLPSLVAGSVDEPWDGESAQILAAALLIGKRQGALGAAVLAIGGE